MNNQKKRLLICILFALLGMFFNWRVANILIDSTVIKYDGPWFTFLFFYILISIFTLLGDKRDNLIHTKTITAISILTILIGLFLMISGFDENKYLVLPYFIETAPAFFIILIVNRIYFKWILIGSFLLGLFITLPFHYVVYKKEFLIFPKNQITFSNTIIDGDDIKGLIQRYNAASLFEKQAINNDPLMRKLREKGIIGESGLYQTN